MSAKKMAIRATNSVLALFNARIVNQVSVPSWEHLFKTLKRYNFRPATVFDIGVAYGTPWLYKAFPRAFYYLIDPLKESLPHMEEIASTLNAKVLNLALGDHSGTIDIEVHEDIGGSTSFEQVGLPDSPRVASYSVELRRLDEIVPKFECPAFCKIDVQGAELGVLRGMAGILGAIDVIVVECHTLPTLKGIPEAPEVIDFLAAHRFCVYDIVSIGRRPLDGATAEIDIAFVKRDSVFREDKRWRQ